MPKKVLTPAERLAQKLRTRRIFEDPESVDMVCDHIANGGDLIELAKALDIQYSAISKWLRADEKRSQRFEEAVRDRNEWFDAMVLRQIRLISDFDIRELYHEDGELKKPGELSEEAGKALSLIERMDEEISMGPETRKTSKRKVRLWDKMKALELMAKHRRLITDRVEHTGRMTLEELVHRSMHDDVPQNDLTPPAGPPPAVPAVSAPADAAAVTAAPAAPISEKEIAAPDKPREGSGPIPDCPS